jgi:hypothetical protein
MIILFSCVGFLACALMAVAFSGFFKRLLESKQDLLLVGVVCGICLILGFMLLTGLGLLLVLFGVPAALLDGWVLPLMTFGFYGGMGIISFCCLYLFMVRLPTAAINRRRQVKELTRLGWSLRKPNDILDVTDFKRLLIIGITLWSSQDIGTMKMLQNHFRHEDWSVQVFFVDDVSRLAGIQSFNPGVDAAWPTPILTEYQDGVLVQALYGEDALKWMKQA